MRFNAEIEAFDQLAKVAGDPYDALHLALAIRVHEDLSTLADTRRRQPEQMQLRLRNALTDVRDRIEELGREITREQLLGQSARDRKQLRQAYRRHLWRLEDIQRDRLRDQPQRLKEFTDAARVRFTQAIAQLTSAMGRGQRERVSGEAQAMESLDQLVLAQLQRRLSALGDPPPRFDFAAQIRSAEDRADALFAAAWGEPARLVAEAQAERWRIELGERARSEAFQREVLAYEAAPRIYLYDRWLDLLDELLPGMHKYVWAIDRNKIETWLNLERESGLLNPLPTGGGGGP
jgi:hypothetical protein